MPESPPTILDGSAPAVALHHRDYALILLQLSLLCVIVWQFHLEEKRHLLACVGSAALGFAIHAQLPLRFRRAWFLVLSLGGLVLVLGPSQAAYAIAVGLTLLAAARLPIPFSARAGVVLLIAAACVWLRGRSDNMFWPIVGSMFMFRLLLYMLTGRREARPSTWGESLSYFFMLPNVFFPLFPVVDYRTFRDNYYNAPRREIYQTGAHWMIIGAAHLLVYRLIRYELLPSPVEVNSARQAVLYLALTYALYLRISGHFHLICGILHLFGFNLPRTHDHYFLAASFSDIWRRINIYWKDFMMQVFFFPAFFRARRFGNLPAVAVAVLWVFAWTWLGHSWQVFWLMGDFPLRWQDAGMWLGVGAIVALSSVWDYRRAARGRPPREAFSVGGAVWHSMKVIGVFSCVALFWARWTDQGILQYLLYTRLNLASLREDAGVLLAIIAAAIALGVIVQFLRSRIRDGRSDLLAAVLGKARLPFESSVTAHLVPLLAVLLLSQPPVYRLLGERAERLIAGLQVERPTATEAFAAMGGYYERLNEGSLQAGPFLGNPARPPEVLGERFMAMTQPRDDLMEMELIPGWQGEFSGALLTVNRWGFRDRERSLEKPPGTFRIAVVGSSAVMGYGVEDDETFTRLLEHRLNEGPPDAASSPDRHRSIEVLNFGVGRYVALHRRVLIEKKVLNFNPDLVIYVGHQDDLYSMASRLAVAVHRGIDLEDPCLEKIARNSGARGSGSEALAKLKLQPHVFSLLTCTYERIASLCNAAGAHTLFVYMPIPGVENMPFDPSVTIRLAAAAGMETADFTNWWDKLSASEVTVGKGDNQHPNARGQSMIADRLHQLLQQRPHLLQSSYLPGERRPSDR